MTDCSSRPIARSCRYGGRLRSALQDSVPRYGENPRIWIRFAVASARQPWR
jgi:hypothetical protein